MVFYQHVFISVAALCMAIYQHVLVFVDAGCMVFHQHVNVSVAMAGNVFCPKCIKLEHLCVAKGKFSFFFRYQIMCLTTILSYVSHIY